MPVAVAVLAGAAVLLTLSMVAGRASVYTDGVLGWPRPLVAGAALLAGGAAVLMSASGGRLRGEPTLGSLSSAAGLARVSVAVAAVVVASTLLAITRLRRDALEWAAKEPTLTE
jgi:hypothetical protein